MYYLYSIRVLLYNNIVINACNDQNEAPMGRNDSGH